MLIGSSQLVLSLREADALVCDSIGCMLCYCCYDNEALSAITLDDLMLQVATHASNELKHCYKVLTDIMVCVFAHNYLLRGL